MSEAQVQQMQALLHLLGASMQKVAAAEGAKSAAGMGEGPGASPNATGRPVAGALYTTVYTPEPTTGRKRPGGKSPTPTPTPRPVETRARSKTRPATSSVGRARPGTAAASPGAGSGGEEGQKYPFYGIAVGREVKVSRSWTETKKLVNRFPGNKYKGFHDYQTAQDFVSTFRRT